MSDIIATARGLLAVDRTNPEYNKALIDMVCDYEPLVGINDADEKRLYVERLLGLAPPLVDDTFEDLATGDMAISIMPETVDGKLQWTVFLPGTREVHFATLLDGDEKPLPFDPDNGIHMEPYGDTSWDTLQAAVTSVVLAVRAGSIVFNDGTVAQ